MKLRITHFDEEVLRAAGRRVERFDAKLRQLANDMLDTMFAADGIGLAAQQVGLDLQFCVVDLQLRERDKEADFTYTLDGRRPPLELLFPMALANPVVECHEGPTGPYEEGCLSFPDIRGMVIRPLAITVRYQDLDGQTHTLTCDSLLARCIQHEVDHLNGVLFIDRMTPQALTKIETKVKKLRRETRDFLKEQKAATKAAKKTATSR
jgi:peptide deformylase